MTDRPTLLDRLLPAALAGGGLRGDLLRLLNTRCTAEFPPGLEGLADALPGFGLPDLSPDRLGDPATQRRLVEAVARKVAVFETRLAGPRVAVVAVLGPLCLRLRLEATRAETGAPFAVDLRLDHIGAFAEEAPR